MTNVCEICGKEFAVTKQNLRKKVCSLACRTQKHRMAKIRSDIKTALKELGLEAHGNQIASHYAYAKEKHPYFCDIITCLSESGADTHLDIYRSTLKKEVDNGCVEAGTVLMCEFYEALQAYKHSDTANAVEECYDAISVLLRTIDVLEGRQKLGKDIPNEHKNN